MVRTSQIPTHTLLSDYVASGAYADCYVTDLPAEVTLAQFVEAFYTTSLFRAERFLLAVFMSRPSTDSQAKQLAEARLSSFAAWSVEARAENQLVMAAGRTRSWLMVAPASLGLTPGTQLFFGSVLVPRRSATGSSGSMGLVFTALLGFHKLYSRALLAAARSRLARRISNGAGGHRRDA